jgi:hypothetical protein
MGESLIAGGLLSFHEFFFLTPRDRSVYKNIAPVEKEGLER